MAVQNNGKYVLTATQKGAIGEGIVASALLRESGGRLSPFYSIADDDGIDMLVYDKETGVAIPIQVKSRTTTLNKPGKIDPSNAVHFEVRAAALREFDDAHLVAVLLNSDMTEIRRSWLIPMQQLSEVARVTEDKLVIRPNSARSSADKYTPYRCPSPHALVVRLIAATEQLALRSAMKRPKLPKLKTQTSGSGD